MQYSSIVLNLNTLRLTVYELFILMNERFAFDKWISLLESLLRNLFRNRFRRSFDSYFLSKFDFVIQKESFYYYYCRYLIIFIIHVIVRYKCRDKVMIRCETCIFDEVISHISYLSIYSLFTHLLIYSNLICRSNRSKSKTSKHDMSTSIDVDEMSSVINVDKIEDRRSRSSFFFSSSCCKFLNLLRSRCCCRIDSLL